MPVLNFPKKSHRFTFTVPAFSTDLAEFCGIMLGDGGISAYQACITLGSNEKGYGAFILELIEGLFFVEAGTYERTNSKAFTIFISRIGIVEFLVNTCGLIQGDKVKSRIDIPTWIMENEEYRIACIRGLMDTDGSIFTHRYFSKGKEYSYKKLSFTSASPLLLNSVLESFKEFGMHARIGSRVDVRLDSKADIESYFKIVGTHNSKHLKRYESAVG